jgi:hypothetical protein
MSFLTLSGCALNLTSGISPEQTYLLHFDILMHKFLIHL